MPRPARRAAAKAVAPKRPDGRTLRARPRAPGTPARSGPRRQAILDAGALERVLRDGMAAGAFRTADPAVAAFGILGMCFWVYKWFRAGGRADVADVSRTFQTLALRGVAQAEAAPLH